VAPETVAPPEAVLLVREEEGNYDEGEAIADPFKLGTVKVVQPFPPPPSDPDQT